MCAFVVLYLAVLTPHVFVSTANLSALLSLLACQMQSSLVHQLVFAVPMPGVRAVRDVSRSTRRICVPVNIC